MRTAMAIRVNTAMSGKVGCSTELVEAYLGLLAANVTPIVRRTGSIGCADIGLMGQIGAVIAGVGEAVHGCLLYTSPSPRDRTRSRMPASA